MKGIQNNGLPPHKMWSRQDPLTLLGADKNGSRWDEVSRIFRWLGSGFKEVFSHRDNVSLANPYGPPVRGWQQVAETIERTSSLRRDGEIVGIETITTYVTADLGYVVQIERVKAKIGAREEITPYTLRATNIFRREDGVWKLVHRHADPITTVQPPESVLQQ